MPQTTTSPCCNGFWVTKIFKPPPFMWRWTMRPCEGQWNGRRRARSSDLNEIFADTPIFSGRLIEFDTFIKVSRCAVRQKQFLNLPVMQSKCATCPFGEHGDLDVKMAVLGRLMQRSQECHHPRNDHKPETHFCRGARDEQLEIFYRLGLRADNDSRFFRLFRKLCDQFSSTQRLSRAKEARPYLWRFNKACPQSKFLKSA